MVRVSRETKQKELLKNEVKKFKSFFTARELFSRASKKDRDIGIATVYRFLKEMRKSRNINSYICERRMIYSLDKNIHCHFTCERSGKVIHFEVDDLNFLKKIRKKIPGEINSVLLEINGVCNNCLEKGF